MITWTYESNDYSVIHLPLQLEDEDVTITLLLESDETLENAFLYTSSTYSENIWAKLTSNDTYLAIGEYNVNPTCFIGTITADTSYSIDFKMNLSSSFSGEQVIPIMVGYGPDIVPYSYSGINFFWHDDSTDDPFFWYNTSEEVDNYMWRDSN